MSGSSSFFLLIPAMYVLFTLALGIVAVIDRRLVAARWAAAGFAVACVSIIVDGYRTPGGDNWVSWFTVVTHFVPLLIMIQAFLSRHGRHAPVAAFVLVMVASVYVMPNMPWAPPHAVRGWAVQLVCTLIIASGLPILCKQKKSSVIDTVACLVVFGAAASYACRTGVMVMQPIGETQAHVIAFYSGLNIVFHLASALMAVTVGIVLMMAIGLDALRLRTREGEVDSLTGLGNRRMYDRIVAEHASGDRTYGAVLVIDLDHFKRINDRYGHAVGDEVLRAVGGRLKGLFGSFGRVCRVGGEEFVMFVHERHAAAVSALALSARAGIADMIPTGTFEELRVTASVGFHRGAAGEPLDNSVRLADQAVYRAKADGRDRVVGAVQERGLMTLRAVA